MFWPTMRSLLSTVLRGAMAPVWMAVLILAQLSNPAVSYPGRDGGIFLYIGSRLLRGGIPYVDAWENKGPLVFFINALGLWLGDGSRWGVWLLEFMFLLVASVATFAALRRLWGSLEALIGTFVMITSAGSVLQGGNFSEEFSLLFSCTAVGFFLAGIRAPGRNLLPLGIGTTLGLNLLLRPNLISIQLAVLLAYALIAVVTHDGWVFARRLLMLGAGFAAVVLPTLLYMAHLGALEEMFRIVWQFNVQYSQEAASGRVLDGVRSATAAIGPSMMVMAAAGYIAGIARILQRGALSTAQGQFLLLPLVGAPMELVLSTLSGRSYLHYFIPWAPYLGVLSASLAATALSALPRPKAGAIAAGAVLMALPALMATSTWTGYRTVAEAVLAGADRIPEYEDPVALYIRANTEPEETVFIWGFRPIVNFIASRDAPVSYLPYPIVHVETPLSRGWADEFRMQLISHPPVLIVNMIEDADRERIPDLDPAVRAGQKIRRQQVVLAENLPTVLSFVEANYVPVATVSGSTIYRLRPPAR